MIATAGLVVLVFFAWTAWRLLGMTPSGAPGWTAARRGAVLGLLAVGAVLFFRPHEPMLSGQDQASYLHAAVRFAREDALIFTDPVLEAVAPDARADFLYGHRFYGLTRYNCLWIRDLDKATLEPRFQPIFSVLLALFTPRGHWNASILYVTPALALLAVLALLVLLAELTRRFLPAFLAAAVLLTMPLFVWHARTPRPEVGAAFLLMAGMALVLRAVRAAPGRARTDLLTGAACLALAPLFHVIAWFAVIPCAVLGAWLVVAGRRDLLWYPAIAAAGLGLFVFQFCAINDPYSLRRVLVPLWQGPLWILLPLGVGLLPLLARLLRGRLPRVDERTGRRLRLAAAGLLVTGSLVLYALRCPIGQRDFEGFIYHYAYPTDLRVAAVFLSHALLVAALAGAVLLLTARRGPVWEYAAVTACLLPGTFLIGNMYDVFLTRYVTSVMLPMLGVGVGGLFLALCRLRRAGPFLAVAAAVLLIGGGLRGRVRFLDTTEYRGFARAYAAIAADLRRENAIVLGEYSRVIAPLEHAFGLPTLAFDNQTRTDYRRGLEAWRTLTAAHPDRTPFLLTPYPDPYTGEDRFELVRTYHLPYTRLEESRYSVPRQRKRGELTLHLYRMQPGRAPETGDTFVRLPDDSNLGLANFSRLRRKSWPFEGVPLTRERPCGLIYAADADTSVPVLCFMAVPAGGDAAPAIDLRARHGTVTDIRWHHLFNEWWALTARGRAGADGLEIELAAAADAGALLVGAAGPPLAPAVRRADPSVPLQPYTSRPFDGRWSRAGSRLTVPDAGDGHIAALCLYAPPETGDTLALTFSADPDHAAPETLRTGKWLWHAWQLPPADPDRASRSFTLHTSPVWNPGKDGYPPDLGVRIGCIAVLPGS